MNFCGASSTCRDENRGQSCAAEDICNKGVCASDDASLETLSLNPALLQPNFSAEQLSYTALIPYFASSLALEASPAANDATMSYSGDAFTATESVVIAVPPESEPSSVQIDITAPSGRKQSYDVTLERRELRTTYVKAFNSRPAFGFGTSVAIDGDTAVFGAPGEDGSSGGVDGNEAEAGTPNAGAAYVAVRGSDGMWQRQAYLKADQPAEGELFGTAVAIHGDTIAIGAPGPDGERSGAVYTFVRDGSGWTQTAKLVAPQADIDLQSGTHVALQGDRLLVAPHDSLWAIWFGGAVYSFVRSDGAWKVEATHPIPDLSHFLYNDGYGYRISFSGDRVAVSEAAGEASVFVMLHTDSGWTQEDEITLDADLLARADVALDGDTLAAAVPGAVHMFVRSGSDWVERTSLAAFDSAATKGFGATVALKDDLLVVGSYCDGCAGGGISTFMRRGDSWMNGKFIRANYLDSNDALGISLATSGVGIAVGAPLEDSNATSFNQSAVNDYAPDSGAALIYE